MKKIKVFAIIIMMALAGLFSACNNDNYRTINEIDTFVQDFEELRKSQQEIISGVRTRNSGTMTDEDILNMAMALDSTLQSFIENHKGELVRYMPNLNIDEDDIDLMIVDTDEFLTFVQDNFSTALYNELSTRTNTNNGNISHSDRTNMNPLELVISSSYEVFDDFREIVALETDYMVVNENDIDDLVPINGETQKPYKDCERQKNMELNKCELMFYATNFFGIIAGVSTAGLITFLGGGSTTPGGAYVGTEITTLANIVALRNYINCLKTADKNYNQCKENN